MPSLHRVSVPHGLTVRKLPGVDAQDLNPRVASRVNVDDCAGARAGLPLPEACDGWDEAQLVESSISVCRVARNCLPEVDEEDAAVCDASSECLGLLLWFMASPAAGAPSSTRDSTKLELLLATALQAVGNAVSSSERLRAVLWETSWPSPLVDVVLREGARCRGIVGMIVYNALRTDAARLEAFAHDEAAGDFLAAMLATTYGARAQLLSEAELKHIDDAAEWTQLLVAKLLQSGHLIATHQRLSTMPKVVDADTEKQLWFMLEDIFTADADGASQQDDKCEPMMLRDEDYGYMASEFGIMITLCMQDSEARAAASDAETDAGGVRVVARMMQVLQVLGACTVRPSKQIRNALRQKGLIKTCAKLLESMSVAAPGPAGGSQGKVAGQALAGQAGLKRDLVRVLANMCYEDRASQDEVREVGAIPLILACTNIDESNPFSKEWAVLAVRNLCDNNLENQEVIAKLQPQHVDSVPPELQQKGVEVKLDKETGKIKVVRDKAQAPGQAVNRSADYLGVGDPQRRAQEMRDMGFGYMGLAAAGAVPGVAESGHVVDVAGGVRPGNDDEGEDVNEMARSLREMGMHAHVDPDTGLMDISHPSAAPSRFHYPLRHGQEGPS